jgi:hypothetical protein
MQGGIIAEWMGGLLRNPHLKPLDFHFNLMGATR